MVSTLMCGLSKIGLAALCWRMLIACAMVASSAASIYAQDWDVIRIFIPEDQTGRLVNRNYQPVDIDELSDLLRRERDRRNVALLDAPQLEEAFYLARLEEDTLFSEQSRWVFSGRTTARPMVVGDVSLALRQARGLPVGSEQLLDYQQITSFGDIELMLDGERVVRWFGFSKRPETPRGKLFEFRLPVATSARMLIATDNMTELASDDIVIQRIANPNQHIPSDWPASTGLALNGSVGRQWWLLHLSGENRFDLNVTRKESNQENWFKHVIDASAINYQIGSSVVNVEARFRLQEGFAAPSIRCSLSSALRVSRVLVDGTAAPWKMMPSLSGDSNLLEIDLPSPPTPKLIEVFASGQHGGAQSTLPEISVAESFTLRGNTQLAPLPGVVIQEVHGESCTVVSELVPNTDSIQSPTRSWSAKWVGTVPRLTFGISSPVRKWVARSITRFTIQSDWLSANCRIRLNSRQLESNLVQIQVGRGWFVDSVKLIQSDIPNAFAELSEKAGEQNQNALVNVNWDEKRESAFFELEVIAHRPQPTDATRVRLVTNRLLAVGGADQIDNYVIEPSRGFQIQIASNLLRFQLQPLDLPAWQQDLLPAPGERWIFQGVRNVVPRIDLEESQGSYSAEWITALHDVQSPSTSRRQIDYLIRVQPISGSVRSVNISIPTGLANEQIDWQLLESVEASEDLEPIVLDSSDESATVELSFQDPLDDSFVIFGQASIDVNDDPLAVPVPSLPNAITAESSLLAPSDLVPTEQSSGIELFATPDCCSDELSQFYFDVSGRNRAEILAARLDPRGTHRLVLEQRAHAERATAYVASEAIDHWIDGSDTTSHRVNWQIRVADRTRIEINPPEFWDVEFIRVDGKLVRPRATANGEGLLLDLNPHQASTVSLQANSHRARYGWLSLEAFAVPDISIPVYATNAHLHVPPSQVALATLPRLQNNNRLLDRLLPTMWWRWLTPIDFEDQPFNRAQPGWTATQLTTGGPSSRASGDHAIWVANRAGLSGLALALTLAVVIIFWRAFGTSIRLAWLSLGGILVALVLVPLDLVPFVQLLLLAAVIASMLRLIRVVIARPKTDHSIHTKSRVRGNSETITAMMLLLLICWPKAAQAQRVDPKTDTSILGVFIPLDEDGEAGSYAYVPSRLLTYLNGMEDAGANVEAPRVLSADYVLRVNSSVPGFELNSLQEFSAEFRVQMNRADRELRLPIRMDELPLQRFEVNGQADFFGDVSVTQDEQAVVFQANMPGTYVVKLYFLPQLIFLEPRIALRAQIPVVPSANLRVTADPSTRFEADSIGASQRNGSDISIALGPIEELSCSWYPSADPTRESQEVRTTSRLWVHVNASELAAVGRLEIENSSSLPELFHLVVDASWEPIGTTWGDVELVSSELQTLTNRRQYAVRFRPNRVSASDNTATIDVVLTPVRSDSSNRLPLPFVSVQESSQDGGRTFTWSQEGNAQWSADAASIWPTLDTPIDWGGVSLFEQATHYRAVESGFSTALRRSATVAKPPIHEITQVHLSAAEAALSFRAQWTEPVERGDLIRFDIPRDARVDSVLVDGLNQQHQVVQNGTHDLLIVELDKSLTKIRDIDIQLASPVRLALETPLPRIIMHDAEAQTSVVQLLRGTDLRCEIVGYDPSLETELEKVSIRPTDLLASLESLVGQLDLGNKFRKPDDVPFSFVLRRAVGATDVDAVMYLDRDEQGWIARVEARWKPQSEPAEFVFLTLPSELRDSVDTGSLPRRFIPSGDSSRVTLCVMPSVSEATTSRVTLRFPINISSSSQSLSIPDIRVLTNRPISPVIALPLMIDEQRVQWRSRARSVEADWTDPFLKAQSKNYVYYHAGGMQRSASWELLAKDGRSPHMLGAKCTLTECQARSARGYVDYWIQPRGKLEFELRLPEGVEVIGAQVGHRATNWQPKSSESIGIVLQPNYIPVNVRVLLHWRFKTNQTTVSIPVPTIEVSDQATPIWGEVRDNNWSLDAAHGLGEDTEAFVDQWASVVGDAVSTISALSQAERDAWAQCWRPQNVDINSSLPFSAPASTFELGSEPTNVNDFWTAICEQIAVTEISDVDSLNTDSRSFQNPTRLYQLRKFQMDIAEVKPASNLPARISAAGLLAAAVLLIMYAAGRSAEWYYDLLANHPWIYWIQLAILSFIFIPVLWPGFVLLVTSAGMAIGQFLDHRRRIQFR